MPSHRPYSRLTMPVICLVLAIAGLALGGSHVAPLFWITAALCLLTILTNVEIERNEAGAAPSAEKPASTTRLLDQTEARHMADDLAEWMHRVEDRRAQLERCIDTSYLKLSTPLRNQLLAGCSDARTFPLRPASAAPREDIQQVEAA